MQTASTAASKIGLLRLYLSISQKFLCPQYLVMAHRDIDRSLPGINDQDEFWVTKAYSQSLLGLPDLSDGSPEGNVERMSAMIGTRLWGLTER